MKYSLLQAKKQTVVLFSFKGNYLLLQNTIKIYYAVIKNTFYLFICTSQLMDHFLADLKCTLAVSLNNDIRCCFILCSSCFHQIRNILYILVTIQKRTFVTVLHAVKNGLRICFQKNNVPSLRILQLPSRPSD